MSVRVDAACQGVTNVDNEDFGGAAGDVARRALEQEEWLGRVEQSPDQLPRRSSSERRLRSPSTANVKKRRGTGPSSRIRRLNHTALPSMTQFFRQVAVTDTLSASKNMLLLYLCLVLMPSMMELGPRIDFPDYWEQTAIFCFLKRRRLQLTLTGNLIRVLIRSLIVAIIPLIGMRNMEHPNLLQLRMPQFEGPDLEMPVSLNIYAFTLLPYVLRLKAGFCLYVADTWVAYSDQVLTIADTFNTWRMLVYLNQVMQLVYSFEMMILFVQGFLGLVHAYRVYKALAGFNSFHVPAFDALTLKDTFWFRPSRHTIAAYKASRERSLEYFYNPLEDQEEQEDQSN
ncbi:uncharacterized protein [Drosophila takahashii]|uniref:uncharacterized protein n=1 Tax=Drosophila takahashii TaxID=29030 RepID=UPI001CF8513F|nr:uncharacterized protein LOC108056779 [Drosophila takahashii]